MRIVLSTLTALLLVPTAAGADTVGGNAAIATFEHVSVDGCVITVGEIALVQVQHGESELASGFYAVGSQEDICLGTGNGFAGYTTDGDGDIDGLGSAHFAGTLVAESYSGGAAVTLELDLAWSGQGAVTSEGGVFHDEGGISFTFGRRRAASTSGDFTVDGAAVTVTSALLVGETSGQVGH